MKKLYIFLFVLVALLFVQGNINTVALALDKQDEEIKASVEEVKSIPIFGEVDLKSLSLPIVAVTFGIVDGFNPCAMWVLLFLISMLLGMKDRKRMWIIGLTFLFTAAFVYFVIMMSWISIAAKFSTIVWLRNVIAIVAMVGGFLNLKSYMQTKEDGCDIIDDNKRTKIFDKIKKFTHEKSFVLALLGVIALAITVNVIELACSAGFPLVFSQILVVNEVTQFQALIYTLIYILFFLIDDLIIFFIAMTTLKMTGFSTKYGKYSHLVGGILMLIIGALLLLKPEWIMFNF